MKYCECGCGEVTPIANRTRTVRGQIKGQPLRFINGHNRRGFAHSIEAKQKISLTHLGKPKSSIHKNKLSRLNKGKTLSLETRLKISAAHSGPNNANWKGGLFDLNYLLRHNFEYREWRNKVFERDKYLCQYCFKNGKLNAHHLMLWSEHKDLRYVVSNGLTLCESCHWSVRKLGSFRFRDDFLRALDTLYKQRICDYLYWHSLCIMGIWLINIPPKKFREEKTSLKS